MSSCVDISAAGRDPLSIGPPKRGNDVVGRINMSANDSNIFRVHCLGLSCEDIKPVSTMNPGNSSVCFSQFDSENPNSQFYFCGSIIYNGLLVYRIP